MSASDISSSMANEGQRRYEEAVQKGSSPAKTPPTFSTSDLGSLSGSYDVVTCLDVMIHYPQVCMACLARLYPGRSVASLCKTQSHTEHNNLLTSCYL